MKRKALVVANLAGFASFLFNDFDILQKQGFEIVFAANANMLQWDDTKKELERRNIPFYQVDFDSKNPVTKQNLIAYRQIKKLIEDNDFELIHCHTPIAGFVTRLAAIKARRKGTKVIYTTHGFAFTSYSSDKSRFVYYNFEKIMSLFCDAIVTINHEDFENAKTMLCKKVYHINGVGVDTEKYHNVSVYRNEYREKLGIPNDKIMVLSVGELSERKNHQIIIRALSKLENKDDYVYVICGSGIGKEGTGEYLEQLAEELEVDLRLLGFRHDIAEITKCSDIGAIPSVREGLGFAGIQSLCAQVPLVAASVQGIKDYVIDGVNGYLCIPDNADEYAEAISKLSDEKHRNELSKNCYETAKKFDRSVSYKQMKKVYDSVLF